MYFYWFKIYSLKSRFRSKTCFLKNQKYLTLTCCVISRFDHFKPGNKLKNASLRTLNSDIFMRHNLCFTSFQTFVTKSKSSVNIVHSLRTNLNSLELMRYKLCLIDAWEGEIQKSVFFRHKIFSRYRKSLKFCAFIRDIKSYILSYSTVE